MDEEFQQQDEQELVMCESKRVCERTRINKQVVIIKKNNISCFIDIFAVSNQRYVYYHLSLVWISVISVHPL